MVTADLAAAEDIAVNDEAVAAGSDTVVRAHFVVAAVFLLVGVLAGVDAAIKLYEPRFLGGISFLSYGRLAPAAVNVFMYGWLTIGFIGAAYFVAPRIGGRPVAASASVEKLLRPILSSQEERKRLAAAEGITVRESPVAAIAGLGGSLVPLLGLGLITLGVVAGSVEILAGLTDGRRWAEIPIWIDAIMLAGFVIAAQTITNSIRHHGGGALRPAHWFLVASMWWLVLAYAVGNVPGVNGVNAELQSAFFQASLIGLWFVGIGVAVVSYLLPALAGDEPSTGSRLSELGFWSLAFLWSMTGARALTYGPGPDWLETLAAFFSIGLLVPVAILFADFIYAMRGRWSRVGDRITLRLVMAGAVMVALLAVLNLVMALHSSSAVVQYTEWVSAYEHLALYGVGGTWLAALIYHAVGSMRNTRAHPRLVAAHYWLTLGGLLVAIGAMLIAGLQAGFGWASGANSNTFDSVGTGFANTVESLEVWYVVKSVGLGIYALGQIVFLAAVFGRGRPGAHRADTSEGSEVPDRPALSGDLDDAKELSLGRLRFGAAGLFVVAAVLTWLVPALESSHNEPTLLADRSRIYEESGNLAAGREIYVQEGCMYCHTQAVRPIVTDVGLGAVSQAGDYVHETPPLLGVQRIGPDLMHVGSRNADGEVVEGAAATLARRDELFTYLINPRASRPWSTMPSYGHLSDQELTYLADYLASLR